MNEYQKKRGYPCDSEEWFFKMLGAPEYKHVWAPTVVLTCPNCNAAFESLTAVQAHLIKEYGEEHVN